jgi:hypothetical protein
MRRLIIAQDVAGCEREGAFAIAAAGGGGSGPARGGGQIRSG